MKGLEAVKKIRNMIDSPLTSSTIKQGLNVIEKELTALEIIKEKATIIDCRKNTPIAIYIGNLKETTEKEWKLLKEVLGKWNWAIKN